MTAVGERDDDEPTLRIAEWERDSITVREPAMSMRELVESNRPRAALVSVPPSPGKFKVVLYDRSIPPRVKTSTVYARTIADARRVVERGFFGSGFEVADIRPVTVTR